MLVGALSLLGGVAVASPAVDSTVGCERVVLRGGPGAEDGFRILLDAVALPGRRHIAAGAARTHDRSWPHFRNAGVAVRGGSQAVVVEVPEGWRDRVAVSWGASPPSSSVHFAACAGRPGRVWNSYSGGIHLRLAADCVPLYVRVGGRSTTVRVGVGRPCGG